MCKKRTRFIESRARIVARCRRRGAGELATLRHVLEKRDELGKKGNTTGGLNTLSFLKLTGFYVVERINSQPNQPTPRVTHMIV